MRGRALLALRKALGGFQRQISVRMPPRGICVVNQVFITIAKQPSTREANRAQVDARISELSKAEPPPTHGLRRGRHWGSDLAL